MAKKLSFLLEVEGSSKMLKQLSDVELRLNEIGTAIRKAKKEGNSGVYKTLRAEQLELQESSKGFRKELRDQVKEFQRVESGIPNDSLLGLRQTYIKLRKEINQMDTATRESVVGLKKIAEANKVKTQIDDIGASVGDFRTQVGSYTKSVIEALQATGKLGKGVKVVDNSLEGLEATYKTITDQIRRLSAEERKSPFGLALIDQQNKVQKELNETQAELKETADVLSGYANSEKKATEGRGAKFKAQGKQLLQAFGIVGGVHILARGIRETVDIVKEFDDSVTKLSSVTAKSREEIKDLTDQAQELGATTAFTATEVIQLQTELAKLGFSDREILQSTESIIDFSVATGSEVPRAAALAGAALRSFNLDASEMQRVVSVLGVATTKSALTFSKIETQLPIVGAVAAQAGVSIERTAALLGTMADRGLDANTAATSLRNIFLELAKRGLTWEQAMLKINSAQNRSTASLDLFGKRGAVAGLILAQNGDAVESLTEKLTDVNAELEVMADTQLESVSGKLKLLKSAWEGLILSIENGEGVIGNLFKDLIDNLSNSLTFIRQLSEGQGGVADFLKFMYGVESRESIVSRIKKETEDAEAAAMKAKTAFANIFVNEDASNALKGLEAVEGTLNKIKFLEGVLQGFDDNGINKRATAYRQVDLALKDYIEVQKEEEAQVAALQKQLEKDEDDSKKHEARLKRRGQGLQALKFDLAELRKSLEENATGGDTYLTSQIQKIVDKEAEIEAVQNKIEELRNSIMRGAGISVQATISEVREREGISPDEGGISSIDAPEQDFSSEERAFKAFQERQLQLQKEYAEKRKQAELDAEKQKELEKEEISKQVKAAAFTAAKLFQDTLFSLAEQRNQRQLETEIERLETQYASQLEAAQGNSLLQAQLQQELEVKRQEIRKAAFKKQQRLQIAQALSSGALAIVQSLANTALPFPASLIGPVIIAASTAAQIAQIKSQKFAEGGFTGNGLGFKDETGHKVAGVVHDNEYVAPTKQILKYPKLFSFLEKDRLNRTRGFVDGGFTSGNIPQVVNPQQFQESARFAGFTDAQVAFIAQELKKGARDGAREGSLVGTEKGSALGLNNANRELDRQSSLEANTEI